MITPLTERCERIFKAYDIRGLAPSELDADLCERIGSAFARMLIDAGDLSAPGGTIVLGRDMRPTGAEFLSAFADGVRSQGIDAVDLGLCSTDEVYFASGRYQAPGVMLTASHNPAGYNGIKLCRSGARPVGIDSGLLEIRRLVESADVEPVGTPGSLSQRDVLDEFADHVRSFVQLDKIAPLKVVADTANGMGGLVVPAVFAELPCSLEVMYPELDGTFPNHPADPIQPENTADLRKRVVEAGADIGLAFDGDADRVFLVDELGVGLSGSTTTAIIADAMLARHPGGTVIHNLICSRTVAEVVTEAGGVPVRTKVGHSYIKGVMAETDAIFGGEHSAHYYFRDNWRADSGLIAAMVVIEQLSITGKPLSELRLPYERYVASGEINSRVTDADAVLAKLESAHAAATIDRLDGLTFDYPDWWFNVRASNTEPLLRLNLEASSAEDCQRHTAEVLAVIRGE